jgi:branched-subunit amino acid transport protein
MSAPLHENPFAVLTAIVAPAVLTNACSVLCLGVGGRIARVVDRTRALTAEMPKFLLGSPEYGSRVRQLERLQRRAQFLVKSLRLLYAALGGLAASALISVIGAASAYYGNQYVFRAIAAIALAIGGSAVTALVAGCVYMVHETRLAVQNLAEEAQEALTNYSKFE